MLHRGEELGFSASLKPLVESLRGHSRRGRGSVHAPSFRAALSSLFRTQCQLPSSALPASATDSQEFVSGARVSATPAPARPGQRAKAPPRPGHAPSRLRPRHTAACVVITWPWRALTSRREGLRRLRKGGGGGPRLVVLLPESRILSCRGRAAPSLPTMSHLVEPPPLLHNNNNNCEEGEQTLPPPAGLNSERGAAGLGGGMGEGAEGISLLERWVCSQLPTPPFLVRVA